MILNIFNNIGNFFNYLLGAGIGLAVGIVIAIILSLILRQFQNKLVVSLLVIALGIIGAVGGYKIQRKYYPSANDIVPDTTYTERVDEVKKDLNELWDNTNGGFVFEQIKQVQKDPQAPIYPDQIIEMGIQDFGNYECFFIKKEGGKIYNTVFLKLNFNEENDGMVFDGSLMNYGYFSTYWKWYVLWVQKEYNTEDWTWVLDREHIPENTGNRQISLSSGVCDFYQSAGMVIPEYVRKLAFKKGVAYTNENLTQNFSKYGVVEVVDTNTEKFDVYNSFFFYLYSKTKDIKVGETKYVDVSSNGLTCVPIPEEQRKNYPITNPEAYKVEEESPMYYGVYNTQITAKITRYEANKELPVNDKTKKVIDNPEDLKPVEKPDVSQELTLLNIEFKSKTTSDALDFDLKDYPITISFTAENKQVKRLVIDSLTKIQNVNNLFLASNTKYSYTIDSEKLLFDNLSGTIDVGAKTSKLSLDYYYLNGYIVASVGLNPVGTVDQSQFDLSVNPVKIVLTNIKSKKTTEFTFNNNNMLNTRLSQLLELGDYSYSILSDKLIFASTSGTLTITQTDRVMLFNYALNSDVDNYTFTVVSQGRMANSGIDIFSNDTNILEVLKSDYPLLTVEDIKIGVTIYSSEQKILIDKTFNTTVKGTTTLASEVLSLTALDDYYGQTLTVQLKIQLSNGKLFLSEPFTFTHKFNNGIAFEFNFTIN